MNQIPRLRSTRKPANKSQAANLTPVESILKYAALGVCDVMLNQISKLEFVFFVFHYALAINLTQSG